DGNVQDNTAAEAILHRGSFMPGFFVGDAAGFEDWLERERRHLTDRAFRSLWRLAENAEKAGDAYAAAHWARRAAEHTPDDEAALRAVMTLLHRLGDDAGALAAFEDFARRIHREYDASPSLETRALAQSIRERGAEPEPVSAPAGAPQPLTPQYQPRTSINKLARHRTLALLGLVTLLVTAAVSGVRWNSRKAVETSPRVIAVMPFTFQGNPGFSYLGDGMVNLLSTNLDHIGEFRATDAASILVAKKRETSLSPDRASQHALRLGAGMFVLGSIVEVDGRLRVSAALYDARRPGRPIAQASEENAVAKLFELIDAITSQLVAGERRTPAERFTRLALLTTHSVPALRSYLIGEQQFREGRYNEAVESFQSAVQADTTFALGYYRLALAHMWGSNDSDRAAAERAVAYGQRLASSDRALLKALLPFFRGDVNEAERQYRQILVTRPDESEVWYPLGEVLFHHNPMRGKAAGEAKHAFQRALALGPKDGPRTHLVEIAAIERDWIAFDSLFSGIQRGSHFYYVGEMVQALRGGDAAVRARVLATLGDSSDARLTTAARHALFLLEEPEYSAAVLNLMIEPSRPAPVRSWGYVHRAHLAMSTGQPEGAVKQLRLAGQLDRHRAVEHEAWLLSFPFVHASRDEIAALRDRVNALPAESPATARETDIVLNGDREIRAHVRLYLFGLLSAQLGDDAAAAHAADQLSKIRGTPIARELASDLAHAVRAEVLRLRGQPAAALGELERARIQFDANRLNIAPFYAQVRERYVRGELLARLGKTDDALGWFASLDEHGPWGRALLAPAALQQAKIHDGLGHHAEAVRHYSRAINLWQNAEPRFASQVAEAKRRLALLQRAN
ncbi:MAG TPA: BTAD domain-containing putative transcriptional regulator, partial [Longimicrobiales bacterium]